MGATLTQSEVEWLRCLVISAKLTPRLPENLSRKFRTADLVEERDGRTVLTQKGCTVLGQRTSIRR